MMTSGTASVLKAILPNWRTFSFRCPNINSSGDISRRCCHWSFKHYDLIKLNAIIITLTNVIAINASQTTINMTLPDSPITKRVRSLFINHVSAFRCWWSEACWPWQCKPWSLQWRHNGRDRYQITSLTIVYSTIYSAADQRKHQSAASWPLCGEFTVSIWWRHHVQIQLTLLKLEYSDDNIDT